jgi:hypothetical protein
MISKSKLIKYPTESKLNFTSVNFELPLTILLFGATLWLGNSLIFKVMLVSFVTEIFS